MALCKDADSVVESVDDTLKEVAATAKRVPLAADLPRVEVIQECPSANSPITALAVNTALAKMSANNFVPTQIRVISMRSINPTCPTVG